MAHSLSSFLRYTIKQKAFLTITTLLFSCGPAIHYYIVEPKTVTRSDSVSIQYSVRGKPTIAIDSFRGSGSDSTLYRNYQLLVKKGSREKRRSQLVAVLPEQSSTVIAFPVQIKNDSLMASGQKSTGRWGSYFVIQTIFNTTNRPMRVVHQGISALLFDSSQVFTGTPVEGNWDFYAPLTEAELRDNTKVPFSLRIRAIIHYKNATHD